MSTKKRLSEREPLKMRSDFLEVGFLKRETRDVRQAVSEFSDDHSVSFAAVKSEDVRPKTFRTVLEANKSEERAAALRAFSRIVSEISEITLKLSEIV
jgi:hypothetical protein